MATTRPRSQPPKQTATQSPTADAASKSGRIVVVVPTYNERANLPRLVPAILEHGAHYQLVIVDDSSPDGTGQLAEELAGRYPGRMQVVHRPKKLGIGPAYVAGFAAALRRDADIIVQMDADLSHDPADLPRLVAAATQHDLVLGSRYVPGGGTTGWPLPRRLLSRLGGIYARLILGVPVADLTGGFKVWRRPMLAALDFDQVRADGYGFQIETTYRALEQGGRVIELPIIFADRVAGASKLSRRIVIEAAIVVWRLRLERRRRSRAAAPRPEPLDRNS
jgi:dolichol-phosphate mannosyltransferase